jgi:hypothetical protein
MIAEPPMIAEPLMISATSMMINMQAKRALRAQFVMSINICLKNLIANRPRSDSL